MKHLSLIMLLLFALSGCKTADKLYETGDYSQVISKLDGKAKRNNVDRRERSLMIKASNKYFETEKQKVAASSNSDNFKDWKNAKQKLKRIKKESEKIADYPQIREDELDMADFDILIAQLDEKLIDYTLRQYDREIADYDKTGDRDYAMRAHSYVRDLEKYGAENDLINSLYDESIALGHRFIAVKFDSDVFNSWEFRNDFKNEIDFRNDEFNTFTDRVDENTDYTLTIAAEIYDKDENKDSYTTDYSDKVVDYYDTKIDTATNKEIKTPVYKEIEATVRTVEYIWTVEGRVEYLIYDLRTDRRFDSGNFSTVVEDRGVINTLKSGDEDAVPSNIDFERFSSNFYDYDDLIEACFEALADEFNDHIKIKKKLY